MKVGVVLRSGLDGFAETLEHRTETPYAEIPDWPVSIGEGHARKLVTGEIDGREVIVLARRMHLYEGYTAQQVTFGIRELAQRGAGAVILINAAGGINAKYKPGDLVLISDHINLLGANPLTGPSPSFPDMSEAYSREYRDLARQAGAGLGLAIEEGVYAAVPGPNFETPAEIRFLRAIGADLVGMSTVPETIAAVHLGMKVLGISCVSNMAAGLLPQKLADEEVLATVERVKDTLVALLRAIVPLLPEDS